jgi:hypothetical protein
VLQPWEGYWVFNGAAAPVTLRVEPVAAAVTTASKNPPHFLAEGGYVVQLTAEAAELHLKDTQNYLGFSEQASEGRDALDFSEAPGIGSYLSLSILQGGRRYAGNFKPQAGTGQQWDVELTVVPQGHRVAAAGLVTVGLHEHGQLPEGFQFVVIDRDEGRILPVAGGTFSIGLTETTPVRHLTVLIGTEAFAEANAGGIPLVPLDFALEQNYPNPFNPETLIRYQLSKRSRVELAVYNSLGQQIRTLVGAEQDAGRYEVKWDGRDRGGQVVASGVYIYRLRAGSQVSTRKMLMLR